MNDPPSPPSASAETSSSPIPPHPSHTTHITDTTTSPIHDDDVIILNVGGHRFQTRRSTLTRYPNTLLGAMFSPHNHELLSSEENGEYFFDRNPCAFERILAFYRTGNMDLSFTDTPPTTFLGEEQSENPSPMPTTASRLDLVALRDELDFFQIPEPIWTPGVLKHLHARAAARIVHFVDLLLLLCRHHLDNFIDIVVVHFSRGEDHDAASLRNVNRSVEITCRGILDACAEVGFRLLSDERTCAVVREVLRRRYTGLRMSVQMVRHELLVLCLSGYLDVDLIRENLGLGNLQQLPLPPVSSGSGMSMVSGGVGITSVQQGGMGMVTTTLGGGVAVHTQPPGVAAGPAPSTGMHPHHGNPSTSGHHPTGSNGSGHHHATFASVRSLLGRPSMSSGSTS